MAVPNKVRERIISGLKRYVPVITQQKDRDVSEADTVTLVKDIRQLLEIDLTTIDPKKDDQLEQLYLFCKEGLAKGAVTDARDRQDATSRFLLAALLLNNESVVATIRRELRRVVDVLVDDGEI